MNKNLEKITKDFNIIIKDSENGDSYWDKGRTIYLENNSSNYTVLHEIGHVLCGEMCCREHREFAAHGAALVLSKVYKVRINKKRADELMCYYAGYSKRKDCKCLKK